MPPQQVLTSLIAHNALMLGPPAMQRAHRRSHYIKETRQHDIYESSSRDHSRYTHPCTEQTLQMHFSYLLWDKHRSP